MPDNVNHPEHYTGHPSGVECIELAEHLGFCLGNAVKYVFRHRDKGKPAEDLKKARWYIEREITRRLAGDLRLSQPPLTVPGEYRYMGESDLMARVTKHEKGDPKDALVCLWQAALNKLSIDDLRDARWYVSSEIRRIEDAG